jgi:hypothetical protein
LGRTTSEGRFGSISTTARNVTADMDEGGNVAAQI